jgi:metallo-beta-lactamase family protein
MKITPLGAAGGEVTGSAYLVETRDAAVLVDCGMFQGGKNAEELNRSSLTFAASKLRAVLITHGHLDHSGRLPLLFKAGYSGPVYATAATQELAALILRDSAKLQAQDNERVNRKRQRAGLDPVEPIYSLQDVEGLLASFRAQPYHQEFPVAPGIDAFFAEAGHMLGSTSIQLKVREDGIEKRIVFSGDLGPRGAPILRDYEPFQTADVVVMESTYGDRDHRPFRETVEEFLEIIKKAVHEKGKILVPTFAVGRAQVLTMIMAAAFRRKILRPFPVFLDSPMAIEAWKIYRRHLDLFDEEMNQFLHDGSVEKDLATLQACTTAEESKAINDVPGPCLVMAGAGMCTGGRILHHFKQNLWRPESHVVIVGYQARESLGRRLIEGVKKVRLFGEEIAVRASVHTLGGFSAHAGQTDLLSWFEPLAAARPMVVIAHGENKPRQKLASILKAEHGIKSILPEMFEGISL